MRVVDSEKRPEDDDIGAMSLGGIELLGAAFAAIRGVKNTAKRKVAEALFGKAPTGRPGRESRQVDC